MRKEEEELALIAVEFIWDIDWTSQGVSGRQKPVHLKSDTLTVVGKGIRIPAFMTFEPITGSVEDLSTALGRHLHLRPGITAEFSTLAGRRDFELGNRVDIDPICKLLVHSRIGHGLPIDCEVVLISALPIDVRIHAKARWSSIGRNTWHKLQKTGEVAAIEGDVDHLPTCHDAGPLRRYRFQRDGGSFHRDRFRLRSYFQNDWRQTHPVVHKKFYIGLFVCLETWKLYGHGICCRR